VDVMQQRNSLATQQITLTVRSSSGAAMNIIPSVCSTETCREGLARLGFDWGFTLLEA